MTDDIAQTIARQALREAFEALLDRTTDRSGESRGHILFALRVFGTADDRAYVDAQNAAAEARIAAIRASS